MLRLYYVITYHIMNEIEIISEPHPDSNRVPKVSLWKRFFQPTSETGFRPSVGASFFNSILVLLGVRVPRQELYDVQNGVMVKLKHLIKYAKDMFGLD